MPSDYETYPCLLAFCLPEGAGVRCAGLAVDKEIACGPTGGGKTPAGCGIRTSEGGDDSGPSGLGADRESATINMLRTSAR